MKCLTAEGKPCPVRWEMHPDGDSVVVGRLARISLDGQQELVLHGPRQRTLWGISVAERLEVRETGEETPLRTIAGMCERARTAEEAAAIAPIKAIRGQRRRSLDAQTSCDLKVSDSVTLWKQFVADIEFSVAKWEAAELFQLFSVRIEVEDAPPVALLVSKAFLHYLRCWVETRKTGSLCVDGCYGLNVCDWPLIGIGGMPQHYDPVAHMRRATGLPFSM